MGSGFKNDTMLAQNVNFTNVSPGTPTMTTDGQLIIAHTALNAGGTHIDIGNLTSPLGTIQIGYNNPNITLDITGGSSAIERVALQTGTSPVVPTGGTLNFNGAVVAAGTNPVRTDGTGPNTMALEVQISQAIAAADATKIGLCNFDSSSFSVAATGFVTASTTGLLKTLTGDSGGARPPTANNINIIGGTAAAGTSPVAVAGASSTLTVNVQTSQALASADATKIGLSNFNSAGFTVAATGFVSQATSVAQLFTANSGTATPSSNNLNVLGGGGIQTAGSGATLTVAVSGGGFTWTDVTGGTQTIAVQNGYLTDNAGGVTYTLPATASIGDTFIIVGKLGLATITPNANQQLLMGSSSGAVGATGTAVATNVGDSITFVCSTSGASTKWRASSWVGSWTLTP